MAETGLKKYDKMPSRVKLIDVDAWRYAYFFHKKGLEQAKMQLENARNIFKKIPKSKLKRDKYWEGLFKW